MERGGGSKTIHIGLKNVIIVWYWQNNMETHLSETREYSIFDKNVGG